MSNNGEIVGLLINQMSTILESSLRTMEIAGPLFDKKAYLEYISTMLKNIDPSIESFISEEQIDEYLQLLQQKQEEMMNQQDSESPY